MRCIRLLALVVAASCGGGGGSSSTPTTPVVPVTPTAPVATTAVSLKSNQINPPDILVAPSATVTFSNNDGIAHNVTFASTDIATIGNWSSGDRTARMPAPAGTYAYTCTIHPGMNGTVKVQ